MSENGIIRKKDNFIEAFFLFGLICLRQLLQTKTGDTAISTESIGLTISGKGLVIFGLNILFSLLIALFFWLLKDKIKENAKLPFLFIICDGMFFKSYFSNPMLVVFIAGLLVLINNIALRKPVIPTSITLSILFVIGGVLLTESFYVVFCFAVVIYLTKVVFSEQFKLTKLLPILISSVVYFVVMLNRNLLLNKIPALKDFIGNTLVDDTYGMISQATILLLVVPNIILTVYFFYLLFNLSEKQKEIDYSKISVVFTALIIYTAVGVYLIFSKKPNYYVNMSMMYPFVLLIMMVSDNKLVKELTKSVNAKIKEYSFAVTVIFILLIFVEYYFENKIVQNYTLFDIITSYY